MFDRISDYSIDKRLIVVLSAALLIVVGIMVSRSLPVDVLPDLTASTVTILVDAHGMAPEEVETLVAFPIETAMNGATGVRRVRSSLSMGIAVIWIDFEWGTDIYRARQIVSEKLQGVSGQLPQEIEPPFLAPVSSLMGEIMLVGVSSDSLSPLELGAFADNVLRRRLLSVNGVANVLPIGGQRKQFQVIAHPERLAEHGISLQQLVEAVKNSNENASGSFYVDMGQEYLIRGVGRVHELDELKRAVIDLNEGVPVLIEQVANVRVGAAQTLGTASVNGESAVILSVMKQPDANTLELSERIDETVRELKPSLSSHLHIDTEVFRQADFIELAVSNVMNALRDGALLVVLILVLFLANLRTTLISLVALPLSLVCAVLVMYGFGLSINAMTLGGLAIAIGVMVDDAIIYVENIYRRLRQNNSRSNAERLPERDVISNASREIRRPVIVATFIVIAVFIPFFFLSGIEGRLLRPLGVAFVVAVFGSLIVAISVIPALSAYFLTNRKSKAKQDSWLVNRLKTLYRPTLEYFLKKSWLITGVSILMVVAAILVYGTLGHSFLPEFNEGAATVIAATPPGTSVEESTDLGSLVEDRLLEHPAVLSVARRTGRGELDEHTFGSNQTELEVRLEHKGFHKVEVFAELRKKLKDIPGTYITIGQPLSHRIDHMLSGTQAAIAVKIFGDNIYELRRIAQQVRAEMEEVDGIVDLFVEQQVDIPQLRIEPDRKAMSLYGVSVNDLTQFVETAFAGKKVGQILEGQWPYDLVVWFDEESRDDDEKIRNALYMTPIGVPVPLQELATIYRTTGPNKISRENVMRKIVVQANVGERDLGSVIAGVQKNIRDHVKLPDGYFIQYGGQFENAEAASRIVMLLSLLSVGAIILLLYSEFGNFRDTLLIMVNLPLALIGGVFAILFTDGIVSIASLVGFVTLFGIAARNGIILIEQFRYLILEQGMAIKEAIINGCLERMSPILMTALSTGLALIPLALGGGQPGKEIETPMAIVILGGLITSTLLNMIVVPVLYLKFGARK